MNDELTAEIAKVREQLLGQLNQVQNKREILNHQALNHCIHGFLHLIHSRGPDLVRRLMHLKTKSKS